MTIFFIVAVLIGLYFFFKEGVNSSSSRNLNKNNTPAKRGVHELKERGSGNVNYESKVERNRRVIEDAILKGGDITFRYVDRVGTITNRRVTPKRIFMYQLEEGGGQMPCLESYCHLRNDKRTFALFRIQDLNLAK